MLAERARLVRFCAGFTGDPGAAEDLAQETLLEGWRHKDELRDRTAYVPWLLGIARNVCLRWRRRKGKEPAQVLELYHSSGAVGTDQLEVADEEFDLEVELEQRELADLLDRAMSYLPTLVRAVLVERYVLDSPLAEVAARMGLSEGAVAMRVQRGKLALKRILSTELSQEAASYGLVDPERRSHRETNMWCPVCGRQRLVGKLARSGREFLVWCPLCYEETGEHNWGSQGAEGNDVIQGVKTFKAVLNRFFNWSRDTYAPALETGLITCSYCGHKSPLRKGMPDSIAPALRDEIGFHSRCEGCGSNGWATYTGLLRGLPEVQRFWREHPRMRTLPVREIEVAGAPALVASFESVKSYARLDVISAKKDLRVIKMHEVLGE